MKKREFSEAQKQALKLYWEEGTPLTPADYPFFHFGVYVSEETGEISQGATIQLDLKRVDLLGLGSREFSERRPLQAEHLDQIELWRKVPSGEDEGQYRVTITGTTFFWSPNGFFACIADGKPWAVLPLYGAGGAAYAASAVCQAIITRNEAWKIEPPDELRAILASEYKRFLTTAMVARPIPSGDGSLLNENELLAQLPNGKADRDLQRSLMLYPQSWKKNENLANYYHEGTEGRTVVYGPSEVELALGDAPARALDLLDKRFSELKNETIPDVIDILFHHWNTYKKGETSPVPITAAKLCEYRGKKPEGENLRLHWEALRDAFAFKLRDTKSDLNATVFFSESKGENSDGPGARYVYSPGFMLQYALKEQPLYFAPFLRKVWELDPKKNKEAKHLARYLRAVWRMNTQAYLTAESGAARAARWHSWAFLLAETGINVESYHTNANGPRRLMEAMARAVETLYQLEVIAEGGFDIYHPEDRRRAENLPPRGALDTWLSLRVCLAPSAALREALLETDSKRRAGRARDAKALSTERAKKRLRAEGKTKRSGESHL